ncbi:MAG: diguanylate cyclase (GGDEF)-like protein/PAS domain S-box-containing protein [Desulforhopalus sp.]|jgi:diguanylate cyclase (GGDEF)-like protein/PAS domain S-box-containing protein
MHIFNDLPAAVIQLAPDTRIMLSNQRANKLFDWKDVPATQPFFSQFLHEEETDRFLKFYDATSSSSSLFSTILHLSPLKKKRVTIKATQVKQGIRFFLLNQQDVWNSGCGYICEHAAILEAQYQHNPGGILMVNSKMEMLSFNEEFVKIWGIPVHIQQSRDEEASLKHVLSQTADPVGFITKIEALYSNRTEVSTDEVLLKDGRILYRHTYPIQNLDNYLGRVWYFLDVTPLKSAQYQIEKQQIFQKAILENVQDGIISCDSDGKIDLMNRAGRRFYGYISADPIGKDIDDLQQFKGDRVTPLTGETSPLRKVLDGNTIENEEITIMAVNGKEQTFRINGQSIMHESSNRVGAVMSLHDITDINEAKEQLKFMAYHDPLTTLPNRRLFHDLLLQNLKQAERNDQKVGVLFLDMDNFKSINDCHGHEVGDNLLKAVGETLQSCLRDSDLLCRWGGDEFIIGLPENYGFDDIVRVAEKICATVLQRIKEQNSTFEVSVTIGIAISPDHGTDPDRLIRNADVAMYHAKKLGKNRCELFSKEPMSATNVA